MSTTLTTRWQNNARGAQPPSSMPKATTPRPVSNAPVTPASSSRSKAKRDEDGRSATSEDPADNITDDNITDDGVAPDATEAEAATETLNSDGETDATGADEVDTAPAIAAAPPDPARAQFLQTLQRAKEGDLKAFEEIFQLYHRRIYNAVYGMLGDPDDAQDVTQDVFMRLHDALPTLRADEAFSTYLYRIALNLCRDRARRKKRVRFQSMDTPRTDESGESEPMEFPDLAKLPEETITNEELQKRVREAVQTLSEDHKAVIMMHHFQGMEVNDIARILHVPTGTVKSRLARGRDQLHRKLRSYLNM